MAMSRNSKSAKQANETIAKDNEGNQRKSPGAKAALNPTSDTGAGYQGSRAADENAVSRGHDED